MDGLLSRPDSRGGARNAGGARLLFGIEPFVDELPEEARLAADVDLDRIGRLFRLVLPPPAAA